MSSHRSRGAYGVDPRAAGRRRVVGATSVTALGGTALAVFFGSLFAQAFAAESAAPKAAPAAPAAAAAALTVPEKSAGAKHSAAPKAPAAAPQHAAGEPAASSGGS
jgi:hypothetical protein